LADEATAPKRLASNTNPARAATIAAKANRPAVLSAEAAAVGAGPGEGEVLHWLLRQKLAPKVEQVFQVEVTPPLAAAWLALNKGNRKPSRAKVARFAAIIEADQWILNGETVKFSRTGRLLDGQSRLQAIVEARRPAMLEVRGGLPDEAQQAMDCGEARRGTHTLEMLGESHPLVLSPALRWIFKWEQGQLGSGGGHGRKSVLENQSIKPMLERHAGLRLSVAWAVNLGARLRKFLPHSEAAFFHYVFAQGGRLKRDAFFDGLLTGNAVSQPVALLRQRILGAPARLPSGVRIKLTVKAWNAHQAGRNLKELTLAPRESVAEIAGAKKEAA
jgi:hypothetical protein